MKNWLLGLSLCVAGIASRAGATVYELPADGSAVIGTDRHIKAKYQDTLLDIARRYSLGYEEIIRANPGVDMWLPGEGADILLPGRRILPPGPARASWSICPSTASTTTQSPGRAGRAGSEL